MRTFPEHSDWVDNKRRHLINLDEMIVACWEASTLATQRKHHVTVLQTWARATHNFLVHHRLFIKNRNQNWRQIIKQLPKPMCGSSNIRENQWKCTDLSQNVTDPMWHIVFNILCNVWCFSNIGFSYSLVRLWYTSVMEDVVKYIAIL